MNSVRCTNDLPAHARIDPAVHDIRRQVHQHVSEADEGNWGHDTYSPQT